MKPFYQDALVTIYHADFRKIPAEVWPAEARCVVTDPPYEETGLAWDRWPRGWPGHIARALPGVHSLWCFGSLRMFMDRARDFRAWRLAQDIVWEKHNGTSLHNDRFRKVHELAAHYYRAGLAWGDVFKAPVIHTVEEARRRAPIQRQGAPGHWSHLNREECTYEYSGKRLARSVMYAPSVREGVSHATPKPVPILRDLITYSCPADGVVIDPMCGSGSTLLAAKELGRRAVGADGDRAACEEAAERCSQSTFALALGGPPFSS